MAITHITDHVDQAVSRLHEQDKLKPNTEGVIDAIVGSHQRTEDAFWQLLTERGIDTGVGAQLDNIGRIVLQPRNGLSDADYRRYLRARIATNRSDTDVDTLITIARLVLGEATGTIHIEQQPPAAFLMRLDGIDVSASLATILANVLRRAKAAGVRMVLETSEAPAQQTFHFAETSTFLTVADPGSSTTLTVTSTVGWPSSGLMVLDWGTAVAEILTYTAITATTITCSATGNPHALNATMIPADLSEPFTDFGWGTVTDPDIGGVHASVRI
jgi:hypothetical protein